MPELKITGSAPGVISLVQAKLVPFPPCSGSLRIHPYVIPQIFANKIRKVPHFFFEEEIYELLSRLVFISGPQGHCYSQGPEDFIISC